MPISQTKSSAYTVTDSLTCGQTINFSWTQKRDVSNEPFTFSWNSAMASGTNLMLNKSPLTYTLNCGGETTNITDIVPPFIFPGSGNPNITGGTISADDSLSIGNDGTFVKPPLTNITFTFTAPPSATDWKQTVEGENGDSVVDAGGLIPSSKDNNSQDVSVNNNLFEFIPLSELPNIDWRIPDLAPFSGNNPDLTIYTAVNLSLYMEKNPLGFNNGNWQVGQTLDEIGVEIIDGEVAGLEGIYWSTMPFMFDLTSDTGFATVGGASSLLNSSTFMEDIGVLQEHNSVPENTSPVGLLTLLLLGLPKLMKLKHN